MQATSYNVRVERVQPGCHVPAGTSLTTPPTVFVIGRGPDVDVSLDDATISRRHIEVSAAAEGFVVKNLSQRGSTFVNEAPLPAGESVEVRHGRAWIQVGRVLLRVELAPVTIPVHEAMPVPHGPEPTMSPTALVYIRLEKVPRVWIGGQPLTLFPSAARVLARLCQSPSTTVSHDALLDAVDPEHAQRAGGTNLAQLVTYVRDAFGTAIETRALRAVDLRALVIAAEPEAVAELPSEDDVEVRGLLRALIPSRRGVGYAIRLPPSAIRFE